LDDSKSDATDSKSADKHVAGEIVNSDYDEIIQSPSDENKNSSSEDTLSDVKMPPRDIQDTNADGAHLQMYNDENSDITVRHVVAIEPDEWNAVKPTYKGGVQVLNSKWRDYLLLLLEKMCNCVIAFGKNHVSGLSSRKRNVAYIRQHAYCTFKNCCKFIVSVHKDQNFDETVRLQIEIVGEENHGRQARKFRRTSMTEAEKIRQKLKYERPTDVYETLINETPMEKLIAGNFNVPKSPAVLRRLKSLINKSERLHKDVCIELDLLHNLYSESDNEKCVRGFIQRRGSNPFFVTMYTEEQIDLLNRQGTAILYLDATGSLFRKWKGFEKRMLLYSLILPNIHPSEPCVPIAEMISNDHTTEMVSHMLFCLRLDVNRLHKQLGLSSFPAQLVVTDFSWPLIHSVFHSFNDGMTMEIFLTRTYDSLISNRDWSKGITGIFICANHVVHIVVKKVKLLSKEVTTDCKNAFIHSFILLQYSKSKKEAIKTVKLICTVFGTCHMSKEVLKATAKLNSRIWKWEIGDSVTYPSEEGYAT